MTEKILVRIPQWFGDAVVSTIFIRELKKIFPDSSISVLGPPAFSSIFQAMPQVADYATLPRPYKNQTWSVGASLRDQKFDRFYALPRSARVSIEALASRIPHRVGFSGLFRSFIFHETKPYPESAAYPDRYLNLLGKTFPNLDRKPFFPQADISQEDLAGKMSASPDALSGPCLGMAPFSIAPSRTWPMDRFVALANRFIAEKKGSIALVGSGKEKPALLAMKSQIKGPVLLDGGDLTFPELGTLLHQLSGFIGNDSGLMHAVSAFDVPALVVFGASDPKPALPRTGNMTSLRHPGLFCSPCLRNYCVRFGEGHLECLQSISVEQAFNALSLR